MNVYSFPSVKPLFKAERLMRQTMGLERAFWHYSQGLTTEMFSSNDTS